MSCKPNGHWGITTGGPGTCVRVRKGSGYGTTGGGGERWPHAPPAVGLADPPIGCGAPLLRTLDVEGRRPEDPLQESFLGCPHRGPGCLRSLTWPRRRSATDAEPPRLGRVGLGSRGWRGAAAVWAGPRLGSSLGWVYPAMVTACSVAVLILELFRWVTGADPVVSVVAGVAGLWLFFAARVWARVRVLQRRR